MIYECHPNACGVRFLNENNDVLAHANYFQTHECQPREYATTARMNWDNYYRKTRLEELVKGAGKDLAPRQAVQFISDHYDRFWNEEKVLNRTVSQVYNIQSLVLDTDNMKVWMAGGDCPIHIRQYQEFDLGAIFDGKNGATGETAPGYEFKDQKKREAKEAYILSFVDAFDGRFEDALNGTRKCLDIDFSAEAALVTGVMLLKLEDFHAARDFFQRGKEFLDQKAKEKQTKKMPPEYFEICLYLARTYDLLDERSKALAEYDRVARHNDLEDKNLRSIARKEGPYDRKRLQRIVMPYSSYIPFE